LSSSALATRQGRARASKPAVAFAYGAGSAARLTVELEGLASRLNRNGRPLAARRLVVSVSRKRVAALRSLASRYPDLALRWLLPPRIRAVVARVPHANVERRATVFGRYRLLVRE